MNPIKPYFLVITLCLFTGCMNDSESPPPGCGGVSVADGGAQFCVHRANIIERGFRCPPERPHQYEEDEVVVCSDEADVEPERIRRIVRGTGLAPEADGGPMAPVPEADASPMVPELAPDAAMDPEPTPDAAMDPEPTPDAAMDPEPTPDAAPMDPEEPPAVPADLPRVQSICVLPGDVVALTPALDLSGFDIRLTWEVVDRPEGSTSQPSESFADPLVPAEGGPDDDPSTPTAVFFADVAGIYVLALRGQLLDQDEVLYDGLVAQMRIQAGQCDQLVVELVWDTPADEDQQDRSGTDMDLHLVIAPHEFESGFDCNFMNPNPEWGEVGVPDDNCSLDIDDTNGAGPERLSVDRVLDTEPLGGAYVVGVHYYRSRGAEIDDLGPSTATVRIWVDGLRVFEASAVLETSGDWWIPAEIRRDEDGIRVVDRDTLHDARPPARP